MHYADCGCHIPTRRARARDVNAHTRDKINRSAQRAAQRAPSAHTRALKAASLMEQFINKQNRSMSSSARAGRVRASELARMMRDKQAGFSLVHAGGAVWWEGITC